MEIRDNRYYQNNFDLMAFFKLCLVLLALLSLVSAEDSESNRIQLSKEARDATSKFASCISSKDLTCDSLLMFDTDDDYETCVSDNATELLVKIQWLPFDVSQLDIRCACIAALLKLMHPTGINFGASGLSQICSREDNSFACSSNCNERFNTDGILNPTTTTTESSTSTLQCLIRFNGTYSTQLSVGNVSLIMAINGLTCTQLSVGEFGGSTSGALCQLLISPMTTCRTSNDGIGPPMMVIGIILGVLFLCLIILTIVITVISIYVNRKSKRKLKAMKSTVMLQSLASHRDTNLHNPTYDFPLTIGPIDKNANGFVNDFKKQYEAKLISKENFKIITQIGQGAFGIVYKGMARLPHCISDNEGEAVVAVKTMKDNSTTEEMQEFLSEAAAMADFNHPNVMSLLGVCLDSEPMIVLPYMVNGDLKAFLVANRKGDSVETLPEHLDLLKLKSMCLNIAEGMKYLAELKYVHRDLAARNCMIDECLQVKIADFGFTRDIYEVNYYRLKRKTRLPVKWMSPESLLDNKYTEKTDVWSFGVTCWEVYSLGRAPYPGIDNGEIPTYISNGNKLSKPYLCPKEMYSIILSCWIIQPDERPTFHELIDKFINVTMTSVGRDNH